jgi:hypothetical protein
MAAGSTYTPIESYTATGSQSSITFGSGGTLPQTYTDLILVASTKLASGGAANDSIQLNGDTGTTNYSFTVMYGTGSSTGSYRRYPGGTAYAGIVIDDTTSTEPNTVQVHFQNYANTTTKKITIGRYSAVGSGVGSIVGSWSNTAAITSIKVIAGGGVNWASGSTFTLYGIAAA